VDIHRRRQVEDLLRDSEEREHTRATLLQTVLDTSPAPIWVSFDPACERITGNPAGDALLGAPREVNVSLGASQAERYAYRCLRDGVDVPAEQLPMQRAAREGVTIRAEEYELVRGDGTRAWLLMHASPLRERGEIRGAISVAVDITDRKRAEAAVRDSEVLFRTLGEAVPDFLWMADADGRPLYQNPAWTRYIGMSHDELLARGWAAIHHPDDVPRLVQTWEEAVARGEAFHVEARTRRYDGVYRWFAGRTVPLKDDDGHVVKWVGTMTDIHDLTQAKEALHAADRRKDEFLATLAHELRNPLAPIRNSLHILRLTGTDTAAQVRVVDMMERQVHHIVRLVDDLMEVSRITRGKIDLRKELVELAAIVHNAVETAVPVVEGAGHRLAVDLPSEPMLVEADPVRLAQVVANLLNNAAKYTEAGGQLSLTARREGSQVALSVRDTGVGIPAEMLPRVFDLFTQIDRTLGRAQGGLGIGLALVKSLVHLHGGEVEARSDGPGLGSEFTVRLPLVRADAGRASDDGLVRSSAALEGLHLLVVDDSRDAADSLAMLLELMGAEVRTAYDGPSALAALRDRRADVVFLDLGMPGMDGHTVAAQIRLEAQPRDLTLIALTGWGQEEDRRRSREAGFDHHLVKPLDLKALEQLLASLRPRRRPEPRGV
jgi:PAS domain S-box-containing protein